LTYSVYPRNASIVVTCLEEFVNVVCTFLIPVELFVLRIFVVILIISKSVDLYYFVVYLSYTILYLY